MSNLGLGVMINRLLNDRSGTIEVLQNAVGKVIKNIQIVDTDSDPLNELLFTFKDGSQMKLYDGGQSCCERRYMHTDDNLSDFVGAILQDIEVREGPEVPDDSYEKEDVKESEFLIVTTSKGQFTVVNYNEHNGYYGGFWIQAATIENNGE